MSNFWKREIVEMIAPITWVGSPKRLFIEAKRVFFFALAVFGSYWVIDWLVTGVYSNWGTFFLALLAMILVPAFLVHWAHSCVRSGGYNEH